ncbi:hypothetical protein KBY96_09955 [Cyanobium sp. ATX 6A2]|uniref:hypothetical protein n=1 Tax=Cyanobium sp. ATX 6A2 TaxID=2823700 RepID=UPI0020CD655D|nr:hypothetical protein [Cyanobium sp. ATX 6A2]MCP9888247.1 hypothetical protein [Cyanobium sp. ATX 6A2]
MPHADPLAPAAVTPMQVLLAPAPQLSGDGQLRELIQERRECSGGTGSIWYLPPELVAAQGLGQGLEAVVTPTAAVCTWLQLRFGGCPSQAPLASAWLDAEAGALPPAAPLARLS